MGLLSTFSEWRTQRINKRYQSGWDWAAGEMLRGKSPQTVRMIAETSDDYGIFDMGIQGAVVEWMRRHP